MKPLPLGLTHSEAVTVDHRLIVPNVGGDAFPDFRDMPPVFATAYLVAFVEWTCVVAMRPYLEEGEQSVGTHIAISHCAATPTGMVVTAKVELVSVEGRRLHFRASCHDDEGLIGEGTHERAIIRRAAFDDRMAKKAAQAESEIWV